MIVLWADRPKPPTTAGLRRSDQTEPLGKAATVPADG